MGRPAPRPYPLRPSASRVEKHRHPQKDRRSLPAWYYRVATIECTENRNVNPEDFDQDLSELEEENELGKEQDEAAECECDRDDSECDCHLEDEDSMDEESKRSYDGSDAEYYYELKKDRAERKRELLLRQSRNGKKREQQMEFEKAKEEEVLAAYESFKKARRQARKKCGTIPIDSIANQTFQLYSSDHVDRFYSSEFCGTIYATKRVDFYYLDEDEVKDVSRNDERQVGKNPVYGLVYFNSEASCNFGPFRLPTRARRKSVKVKRSDGNYDLWFKFFGNRYLKLKVSRDLVFESPLVSSSDAPEIFEFAGILRNWEKEQKEMAEEWERRAKNRPPSPRESWFEMNHPMGWWNQSRMF